MDHFVLVLLLLGGVLMVHDHHAGASSLPGLIKALPSSVVGVRIQNGMDLKLVRVVLSALPVERPLCLIGTTRHIYRTMSLATHILLMVLKHLLIVR